jgi:hypothetical protein
MCSKMFTQKGVLKYHIQSCHVQHP